MVRPLEVHIDISALKHNLARIQLLTPNSKVLAMIKANAYGHGIVRAAKALDRAHAFGVASLEEALRIREAGIQKPIVLMAGFFSADELLPIENIGCEIVIHSMEQIECLKNARLKKPLTVWLKINTGMNRLGFLPKDIFEVYSLLKRFSSIDKSIRLISHFACADAADRKISLEQMREFEEATKHFLTEEKSMANSAGILNFPEAHFDWVRPGILLYGVSPLTDKTGSDFGLKPAMILRTALQAVRLQKKGDALGYGGTYRCPCDMPIGIIAAGYGDGYPFHTAQATYVLVKNKECPLLGRVAMDMSAIDLRKVSDAKAGDEVVLWGKKNLPVEYVARAVGAIPYALLCGISPRIYGAE